MYVKCNGHKVCNQNAFTIFGPKHNPLENKIEYGQPTN